MTSVWGIAKITVALVCVPLLLSRSVVNQVLAIAAVTTGLILGLFVLGSLPRRVRSDAALIGMLAGFAVSGSLWVFWVMDTPIVAWPWLAPAGTLVTVTVALILNWRYN